MTLAALPIDNHLGDLLKFLQRDGAVVVVAEPGAGKTTRVPRAMLLSAQFGSGDILVLQPRRIACRMSAVRVADELDETPGQRIGYQVRFEDVSGPQTRVRFITEGILTRRLTADPQLSGVSAVVLDEFHERSLHADFALSAVARLRRTSRPELALVVMSATLEAEPVARFLGCQAMHVPGRTFPVAVRYQGDAPDLPLERRVARALRDLLEDGEQGDILAFLPGAAEIRRAESACAALCDRAGRELTVLHGDLPAAAQDRAVRPAGRPKLILSTNIAETSLTLPGVTAVIDSGLARFASHSPFSGLPTLNTLPISQASAVQRMGRAGRVRAGSCLRLYSERDFRSRPLHDKPELARADLSELRLHLAALGAPLSAEQWLQPPPEQSMASATRLLQDLTALDSDERVTALGKRMLRMPLHPRLSRFLLEAESRGIGRAGAAAAAILSERDIMLVARSKFLAQGRSDVVSGPSDVLTRLEAFGRLVESRFDPSVARSEGVDAAGARRAAQVQKRLLSLLSERGHDVLEEADEEALGISLLAAFPDRVAKRRKPGRPEVVFARGGSASLVEHSVVRDGEFMVVVDAAEQQGMHGGVVARMAAVVEPEWILELFSDRVEDTTEVRYDAERGRADAHHVLRYEGLTLDESRGEASAEDLAEALVAAVKLEGVDKVFETEPVHDYLARLRHALSRRLVRSAPPEEVLLQLVRAACQGARTLEDLKRRSLVDYLPAVLDTSVIAALDRSVPAAISLPSGRRLRVHYEADRPPFVASRLQDFFGLSRGPDIAGEPLVLHLLAPNQRPVQVTSDLSGFWERHYPELRKALMRRYPKHPFPDDPARSTPPPPRPPRPHKK